MGNGRGNRRGDRAIPPARGLLRGVSGDKSACARGVALLRRTSFDKSHRNLGGAGRIKLLWLCPPRRVVMYGNGRN
uniref:Uncharacterized protein n=1 Tax=Leersia perrieri TaxID=77586 RepID=A0A0D9X036_9ORYZ